jgi:hypothetical protein
MGLEGIVSKRKDSAYRSGRSPDWLKMKNVDAPAVKREAEEDWGKGGDVEANHTVWVIVQVRECRSNSPGRRARMRSAGVAARRQSTLGPDHPEVGRSLNNLALLYRPLAGDLGEGARPQPSRRRD